MLRNTMMDCKVGFEVAANFGVDKKSFFVLPSVSLLLNNMIYAEPNLAVRFDWLALHARILLVKGV